jgi:hypothetical protein
MALWARSSREVAISSGKPNLRSMADVNRPESRSEGYVTIMVPWDRTSYEVVQPPGHKEKGGGAPKWMAPRAHTRGA